MRMDAKALIRAIENAQLENADELKAQSYSGRAMYGRSCVGVVIPRDVSSFQLAAAVALCLVEDANEGEEAWLLEELAALRVCEDSMGLDTIVYFPRVEWPESLDGDDGEEDDHDCDGPSCCTPEPAQADAAAE